MLNDKSTSNVTTHIATLIQYRLNQLSGQELRISVDFVLQRLMFL